MTLQTVKTHQTTPQTIYLRDKELTARYDVSRATIWRWIDEQGFPKPIKLSPGCSRWKLSDVEQWESEREQTCK